MSKEPYLLNEETNLGSDGVFGFFAGSHNQCNNMCKKFGLPPSPGNTISSQEVLETDHTESREP